MTVPFVKILLVDDHKIVRTALADYLKNHVNAAVIEAGNGIEGISQFESNSPDVVITDINMPQMGGIEMIKQIRKHDKDVMIITLTMFSDPLNIRSVLSAGANSYVLKGSDSEDLINAVKLAKAGKSFYSDKVSDTVMSSLSKPSSVKNNHLTKREMEVLECVLLEKSNQEIADQLFISLRTVEAHKHHIMEKVEAKNIAGLVKYAIRHKLFDYLFYQ